MVKMVPYNPSKVSTEDWMQFAQVSYRKFINDLQKYGDWYVMPQCDICNEIYPHFYVTNEVWQESKLTGWACYECLTKALGRELIKGDMVTFWENLFEVYVPVEELEERLFKLNEFTLINILSVIYGITYQRNKLRQNKLVIGNRQTFHKYLEKIYRA